ncbi:hypothetical protein [Bacillus sp. USDA818B3_A]|uniref:hypothetical protein n=1 Tax=Bacillus sp. USDA818B3_A TaxID=2698834 RepID=UPI0019248DFD|nr:hypothetical protein [Bacillus sp. USDA818B3_A]
MLIHWGAFTFANHAWKEPIVRALEAANKEDVNLIAQQISQNHHFIYLHLYLDLL